MDLSPEYVAALEQARIAARAFQTAQLAYRARTIGDAEYLAAAAAFKQSEVAYDAAYDAERARSC